MISCFLIDWNNNATLVCARDKTGRERKSEVGKQRDEERETREGGQRERERENRVRKYERKREKSIL